MAKKQRFEQIDGLPEALENKADKVMLSDFGGRNYILESNKYHGNNAWYSYGYAWNFLFYVDLKGGETYTISVPVRNNASTNSRARITVSGFNSYTQSIPPFTDNVIKYTFTYPEDQDQVLIRFLTDAPGLPVLEWGLPKLEKGRVATDWTPAFEDFISDWNETDETKFSFIKNLPDLSVYLQQSDIADYALQSWVNSNFATTNEINNIYDLLSAKANERLSNVASNLSQAEKDVLLGKIGAVSDFALAGSLSGYLPLTGGTMGNTATIYWSGADYMYGIIHKHRNVASGGLALGRMSNNTHDKGLGLSTTGDFIFGDWSDIASLSTSWNTVWHSGNLTNPATENWVTTKIEEIELTPGPQGTDGKTWHSGTTNPSNSLGKVGDWHLNRNTWDVREKTGTSTWTVRGNIKGADGSTWYNGVSNPTTQGVVGDWYIKTSTWDVYRKISSNSWNHYGNIKGEDGVPADISNKANTDGSNTIGGTWKIDTIGSDLIGSYLHTGYFDNDSIHIPFSDALFDWKGVELGAENVPVMIAEDKTNNYIYRTGLPPNGYPDHAKTGNYLIESKHRFRIHKHENLDDLSGGVGKVILNPYNAIEHQYLDVNIFGEMEVLELDIQSPQWDELTGHEIRRNPYGQRISVNVRTNAKVMFTNIQGVSFPNGGQNGIYKCVWDGVWLFDGYSPNEF